MTKPKSPKSPQDAAPDPEGLASLPEETPSLVLTAAQEDLIERTLKLLLNIWTAPFAVRARREGYSLEEHREGWRLLKLAAGEGRHIDHLFAEAEGEGTAAGAERQRLLRDVDAFENTWFPRTHAILRRVVPEARRDAFEAGFFKNLEQQPLGPGVILSVSTFLSRLDGLAKSSDPDAAKVRQTLQKRGLTDEKLKEVRGLLKKLEGGGAQGLPKVSREELKKAHEQQREGLNGLRDWYNDWTTTFRDTFQRPGAD